MCDINCVPQRCTSCTSMRPFSKAFEGRYVRLEPYKEHHVDDLYWAFNTPESSERFKFMVSPNPETREAFDDWFKEERRHEQTRGGRYVVIDKASGLMGGRINLNYHDDGSEMGFGVYFNEVVSRKPAATEAFYMMAKHSFEDLSYKRLSR